MKCGLLGAQLSHSYSPAIHGQLGCYSYDLFEKQNWEIESFLRHGDFTGLNVTIPYKKTVIPYLDELTPTAQKLSAVNTIVRLPNGKLLGHNTDYYGFASMLQRSGLEVGGKKALVLGSGGASATVTAVLKELGASVTVISRQGENNYNNLSLHQDARIIVNATPVGMYPNSDVAPLSLQQFPQLEGVFDLIYNPARTRLLQDAQERGLIAQNGLWMLVAQAKESAEYFTGAPIAEEKVEIIYKRIRQQTENTLLIGMPGCGKTTIGMLLAEKTGRKFVDIDNEIEKKVGISVAEIIGKHGESFFRQLESEALRTFGKISSAVIATGGGAVIMSENHFFLRQNNHIIYLKRPISQLATAGRPLSVDLQSLYAARRPLYESLADRIVDNSGSIEHTLAQILEEKR